MMDWQRLGRNRFTVIGRAGMDLYAEPPGTPMEQAVTFSAHLGGSAGNIAAGLSRLGADVELLSCFSDDAVGRFSLSQLDRFGVATSRCRTVGGEARTNLAVVETRLENCQSVIYRNEAADFQLSEDQVKDLDYEDLGGLILTGTALAEEPSRSAVRVAVHRAKADGVPVIIDLDYRPYSWAGADEAARIYQEFAGLCDLVIGNDVEFEVTAGSGRDGLDYAAGLVAMDQGPQAVIYKMGEKGSICFTPEGSMENGIYRVEALKPTGAGDAFMSGVLAGLAAGQNLAGSIECGSAAAAIVVGRVACSSAMPTPDELNDFLADRQMNKEC